MKDKFGKLVEPGDPILFAIDNLLVFGVRDDVNSEGTIFAKVNGEDYKLAPMEFIKVFDLPVNVEDVLRGDDNFGWLDGREKFDYPEACFFFTFVLHYLHHKVKHLGISYEVSHFMLNQFYIDQPDLCMKLEKRFKSSEDPAIRGIKFLSYS